MNAESEMSTSDGLGSAGHRPDAEKDREQLDRLTRVLNGYHEEGREWDHADICNELVGALRETGRTVRLVDDEGEI